MPRITQSRTRARFTLPETCADPLQLRISHLRSRKYTPTPARPVPDCFAPFPSTVRILHMAGDSALKRLTPSRSGARFRYRKRLCRLATLSVALKPPSSVSYVQAAPGQARLSRCVRSHILWPVLAPLSVLRKVARRGQVSLPIDKLCAVSRYFRSVFGHNFSASYYQAAPGRARLRLCRLLPL